MNFLDFTNEEVLRIQTLLTTLDSENYSVHKNLHTIWFQSESSCAELRLAFLGDFQLTISRVEISHKHQGIMTTVLNTLIDICKKHDVHKIVMQSVLTPECAAFCKKNGFKPDPLSSFELNGFISGDWVLKI